MAYANKMAKIRLFCTLIFAHFLQKIPHPSSARRSRAFRSVRKPFLLRSDAGVAYDLFNFC